MKRTETILLDFYEARDFGDFKLTFYPAGHVLGSAQTLIEFNGERLVYTGDFKLRQGLSCESPEIVPCDTLITECTFGRPHFIFPANDDVRGLLCLHIERAFKSGLQPVVFGYSLGKSQEVLMILLNRGYSVAVHHSIMEIVEIYRDMGIDFIGDYRRLEDGYSSSDVLLAPPGARRSGALAAAGDTYTIFLTGWAMDARARYWHRSDAVLPLSDHAGFDDLEHYAVTSGARKVYTLYGDYSFAAHLRRRGIDAVHLHPLPAMPPPRPEPIRARRRLRDDRTLSLFDLIERGGV